MSVRRIPFASVILLAAIGCTPTGPETNYGRSYGKSVNGTSALAAWLKQRGHQVHTAVKLTDELAENADVIIRFAQHPGPPSEEEGDWFEGWMGEYGGNLIYVCRDYDAEVDYWAKALDQLPEPVDESRKKVIESALSRAKGWPGRLPKEPKQLADAESWFRMEEPIPVVPRPSPRLGGYWAEGLDDGTTLPVRATPKLNSEIPWLMAGDKCLAMSWHFANSEVLVIANGSFLLNAGLLAPERRPLAERVVDWIGDEPARVVFVDGLDVLADHDSPGLFQGSPEFRWVRVHLIVFGLMAAWAWAVRLGRPLPDEATDADRPSAHAEALGDLLRRSRDLGAAQALLETYRRWRTPAAHHTPAKRVNRP